jgi:hypothetical protein
MISFTVELAHRSTPPIGAKMTPTAKKRGRTVFGVRIGCQAFRRCCRKALSVHCRQCSVPCAPFACCLLGGLRLFCFSTGSSWLLLASVCSNVCDILAYAVPMGHMDV